MDPTRLLGFEKVLEERGYILKNDGYWHNHRYKQLCRHLVTMNLTPAERNALIDFNGPFSLRKDITDKIAQIFISSINNAECCSTPMLIDGCVRWLSS